MHPIGFGKSIGNPAVHKIFDSSWRLNVSGNQCTADLSSRAAQSRSYVLENVLKMRVFSEN